MTPLDPAERAHDDAFRDGLPFALSIKPGAQVLIFRSDETEKVLRGAALLLNNAAPIALEALL